MPSILFHTKEDSNAKYVDILNILYIFSFLEPNIDGIPFLNVFISLCFQLPLLRPPRE